MGCHTFSSCFRPSLSISSSFNPHLPRRSLLLLSFFVRTLHSQHSSHTSGPVYAPIQSVLSSSSLYVLVHHNDSSLGSLSKSINSSMMSFRSVCPCHHQTSNICPPTPHGSIGIDHLHLLQTQYPSVRLPHPLDFS